MLLLGGSSANDDGLWRLDGGGWKRVAVGGPTQRSMLAAAFDTRRGVLVVFGGVGVRNGLRYGDTWEWNGRTWADRDVKTPGARDHHAMAYDEARGVVVMYGGWDLDRTFPSDTWTWDGANWSRAETTTGPGGVGHHAMAYDARRQRVVMFGGDAPGKPAAGGTWEWDGAHWERVATGGPAPRTRHRLAYDAARGVIVMYGGQIGTGPSAIYPNDTWTWDGAVWTQLNTPGPPPRWVHAMAYDHERGSCCSVEAWRRNPSAAWPTPGSGTARCGAGAVEPPAGGVGWATRRTCAETGVRHTLAVCWRERGIR